MLNTTFALTLHILGAVVWVGGMFTAYLCLRPAAGALEGPQRLQLWRGFFAKFFIWVWVSIVLLLGSGYWMLVSTFGGFKGAPIYINCRIDTQNWPTAAGHIGLIAKIIQINLPLGLIVVAIGGTGRFWG